MDVLNLGKQLDSLVAAFFNAIERYRELRTSRRKEKGQLEFGEARHALFGVHHAPGYFGEFLTGETRFAGNHHRIVMEMAKDESATIERHRKAIHAAVAEFDIKIAAQLDEILGTKQRIYDRLAVDYDKMDKTSATTLGRQLNHAYRRLTEGIALMQKAAGSGKPQ